MVKVKTKTEFVTFFMAKEQFSRKELIMKNVPHWWSDVARFLLRKTFLENYGEWWAV